jgi:Mg-chelatase subunit ChlD
MILTILALAACGKRGDKPGSGAGIGSAAAGSAANGSAAAGSATKAGDAGGRGTGSGAGAVADRGDGRAASADPEPAPAPEDLTLGANIALAVLGGHVVSPAESADPEWRVSNLLDGFPVIRGVGPIPNSLGWAAENQDGVPPAIVIGFRQDREATITAVVVDSASSGNLTGPAAIPKDLELLVSTTSATEGFTRIATATLPPTAGETILRFPPTKAKWVKLAIASTHGAAPPQLAELQIYEAASAASVVADVPKNLLLPALGGSLVRFTSQERDQLAVELVDGVVGDSVGWQSSPGPIGASRARGVGTPTAPPAGRGREAPVGSIGSAAHLPQEFTFAFRDHRVAFIDRLVIDPTSGSRWYVGPKPNTKTWAKTIEVQSSDTSPWDGFTVVKVVDVPPEAKPIEVPLGRAVRFVKIRILENNGEGATTLGEVSAFEGTPPGGRSIVAGRALPIDRIQPVATIGAEMSARREREPNNSQKEADRVDAPTPIGGALSVETDRDVFLVPGAVTGSQTLTVALEGRPSIRTRVTVMDAGFATRYVLDPSRTSGTRARFSVVTGAGDLYLQLLQPPGAQVVIWDTSGSMEHRVADLDAALRDYLGKIQPSDRVQLIRFDDGTEVLLKDFTGQSAQLVAALKGKVYADGGTSIYDAITLGLAQLDKIEGSRAIVMMTDGEDTTSKAEPPEFWAALDRGGARLYAIGLGDSLRNFVARAGATAERVLADAALSTGGRYAYIAKSSELTRLYAEIGAELHAPATYAIAAATSAANGRLVVKAVGERLAVPPRVELVLDASGSMKRKLGGKTMMEAAKRVLTDVVTRLPAEARVALRAYGHRKPDKAPGACEDTELLVPFGALDRKQLTARIKAIKPRGTTPIAFSIAAAAADLDEAKGPAVLILVTDGKEECGGDPAAAVTALRAAGLDVTLSIVGFGLTEAADRDAMTKVATLGGGAFHDAQDEASLGAAIDRAMAVPFVALDATGAVIGRGVIGGEPIPVPEGVVTVRIESSGAPVVIDQIAIAADKVTQVELKKSGDEVDVNIIAPGSAP